MSSAKEKISKLEGLLTRIKERADAPRPARAAAAGSGASASPAHTPIASPIPGSVAPITEPEPMVAAATAAPTVNQAPTVPPPTGWSEPPPTSADPARPDEDDPDMEVEVSSEVVEVDIDIDEPGMMHAAESGAQPVADHTADAAGEPAMELEEVHDDAAPVEIDVEAPPPPPPANEVQEPAPSSSPRPIAAEAGTYESEESAPRHTPPPESGKQVAAPSVKPAATGQGTKVSEAPPSLEGHTLIGGWREPGLPGAAGGAGPDAPPTPMPASASTTGARPNVRVPPPPPPPPPPPVIAQQPSAAPPSSSRQPLVAQVTRAELSDSQVAKIEGTSATFAPATFGELLDATLSI